MTMLDDTALIEPDILLEELERSLATPQRFGRYEVCEVVGEGSMGCVYRALDPLTGRDVAIKALRPAGWTIGDIDECRRRFHREAQAMGGLSHPNVVVIFDVATDFFVMEFLHGETLRGLLDRRGYLPLAEALPLLESVAGALDYAHQRGVIHRDVKPGNIMILPSGRPKVMDFGVAHLDSSMVTVAGQCLGSPLYMAPEQIEGEGITARADLFSFAAVAYEMITGQKAFEAATLPAIVQRILQDEPEAPSRLLVDLPEHIDAVFVQALCKQASGRFSTATGFVTALGGETVGTPRLVRPVAATKPGPMRFRAEEMETQDLRLFVDAFGRRTWPGHRPARPWTRWSALGIAAVLALPVVSSSTAALLELPAPPLAPASIPARSSRAQLDVRSEPSGAIVWVNGKPIGRTPVHVDDLQPGMHQVKVSHAGFAAAEVQLLLNPETREPLTFTLAPVAAPRRSASPAPVVHASAAFPAVPAFVPPRRLSGSGPVYPWAVYSSRMQGLVRLDLTVTETGEPVDITVVESPGEPLSRAFIEAVSTWRFAPALKNGAPARARWQVQQRFSIRPSP